MVEGTGDHGCEYMTGGCVVILGKVGKNNKMFLFPMVFMLIVTITSLVQTLIANFKGLGAGVGIGWCVARIVLAGLLVILALILAVDGFKTLANQKKAK